MPRRPDTEPDRARSVRNPVLPARASRCVRLPRLGPWFGLFLALAACGGGWPAAARAGVYDLLGLGPRAVALGGAYTALADDFTSVYYNPAGLAGEPESSLTLGGLWAKPYFHYEPSGEPARVPKLYATGAAYLGVATNLGNLTGYRQLAPWTLGISLYLPVERALLAVIPNQSSDPAYIFYLDQTQVLSVLIGASWKILEWLSVGVSGNFLADLRAPNEALVDVDIRTVIPYLLDRGVLVKEVRPRIARDAEMKVSPVAGVQLHPLEWLRIGVTYRGRFYAETVGTQDILLRFPDFSGQSSVVIQSAVLASIHYIHYWNPQQVSAGVAFRPADSLWVALDLTWADWSDYIDPMFYAPSVPFSDTFTPRVGLEYAFRNGPVLRAGYGYQPTPVPEQTGASNYLDNDKHVVSTGIGYTFPRLPSWIPIWKKPLTLDAYFQYTQLVTRTYHKQPGFGPSLELGGYMLDTGMSLRLHF